MAYFIDANNKVRRYKCTKEGIELEDGTRLLEEDSSAFCFATDPEDNPNMIKNGKGEWMFWDCLVRGEGTQGS